MRTWSINRKFFIIFGGTALVFVFTIFISIRLILFTEFDRIEEISVRQNNARVDETYKYFLRSYEAKIADWGQWDDTYAFIDDLNNEYIKSNLVPETLENLKTDEVLFFDLNKHIKYAAASPEIKLKEENFPEDVGEIFVKHDDLWKKIISDSYFSGLLKTDDGILLYTAHTIVKSDGSGPAKGVILFGRYIGPWLTDEIRNISQIPVTIMEKKDDRMTSDKIYSHVTYEVHGGGDINLMVETKRDVRQESSRGLYIFLVINAIAVLAYVAFNYYFLYKDILSDLVDFKNEVSLITKNPGEGRLQKRGLTTDVDSLRDDLNHLLDILGSAKDMAQSKADEFQKLNSLMVDRELKMVELKQIIKDLKKKIV